MNRVLPWTPESALLGNLVAGADPEDRIAVDEPNLPRLRAATEELSWLLGRGYAEAAALKLVGDHYQLTKRQRMMVRRCAATEAEIARRLAGRREDIAGLAVAVDGFNQLVTTERGLAGGAVLRGRDGVVRDVASVHGTWRRSEKTDEALDRLVAELSEAASVAWILDAPVSNSGRLATMLRARGVVDVRLEVRADAALLETGATLATSDGPLLERCLHWVPLAERALRTAGIEAVDLTSNRPGLDHPSEH